MSLSIRSSRALRSFHVCPILHQHSILKKVKLIDSLFNPQLSSPLRPLCQASRGYASAPEKDLKETLREIIPEKREKFKKFKADYGQRSLGEVKVENAIGGMRFVPQILITLILWYETKDKIV
jgi:hypothetical protein